MTRYEVSMELWEDNHAFSVFSVRGETESRTVGVNLRDQGEPVDLTGKQVRVYMLTPDGSKIFSDCTLESAEEGKLSFTVSQKALEHRGLVECELWISEEPGTVLKVTGLKIHVRESVMDEEAVEASDEFSALSEALSKIDHLTDDETARVEAEIKRQESEAARIVAEAERKANETNREAAESERKTAENGRVAAEQNRVSEFATLKSESETQSSYAKEQGDYAKEQADRFKDIDVTQLQTQVEELETSVSDTENKIVALEAFKETKGQANGLASLDPSGNLVQTGGLVTSVNGKSGAVTSIATTGSDGKLSAAEIPSAENLKTALGMNKQIYEGDWSTGSITVPEIGNYSVLMISFTGHATSVLAFINSGYIRGTGGYTPSKGELRNFYVNITVSGTNLTYVNAQMHDPVDNKLTDLSISRISGIA